MVSLNLIKEEKNNVTIFPKGEYILKICHTVNAHEDFVDKFGGYINTYVLEDIPEYLVARFYELREISIIERNADVYLPHNEFMENLAKSEIIYGYTSIFFPEYIDTFLEFAKKGKEIGIIVSEDVINAIIEYYQDNLEFGLKYKNVNFYVSDRNMRYSFIVTDKLFSISFFMKNGIFDYKRDFICSTRDCIRWGTDLFNYVRENSTKIDIGKLK
ncbi:hypothetical protein BMS3Bbin15_00625 [archaeon BMS3Bbin15]|nr:hypothetical protein BMS3Bbin15_00625 [archaeon BMS3Bbin15]